MSGLPRAWRGRRSGALDVLLAIATCVFDLLTSWSPRRTGDVAPWAVPAFEALLLVPLAARRRSPTIVFAIVVVHSVVGSLLFEAYVPTMGVWVALYTVASRGTRLAAVSCLAASAVPLVLNVADAVARQQEGAKLEALVGVSVALGVIHLSIFGAGRWAAWSVEQRRLVAASSAAEAVAVERARIARDLHDVVAHSITTMVLLAAGASHVVRTDAGRSERLLHDIEASGQEAIHELRRMLGLLRAAGALDDDADERPGVAALPGLVERHRAAGLDVAMHVTGSPRRLEPGVDVAAYRLVQEALTNATRYADRTAPVALELSWGGETLEVQVRNGLARRRAVAQDGLSTGHGLVGMQERVRAVSGYLDVGPTAEGYWVVRAALPCSAAVKAAFSG